MKSNNSLDKLLFHLEKCFSTILEEIQKCKKESDEEEKAKIASGILGMLIMISDSVKDDLEFTEEESKYMKEIAQRVVQKSDHSA